jgi:uncharacterized protein (DUF3084 family)
MPTIAEAIAKAPQELQPALLDLADALRTDRIVDHIDVSVTRLETSIERLAEAQRRTETRVEELAQGQAQLTEAQRRTETRLEELAQAQTRLAEAQRRTEARLEELAQAQTQLAEAQRRTEARLEELAQAQTQLAEAQRRTEARVEELAQAQTRLAEAQRRTEARVEELAQAQARTERAVQELARQVGGLSDTIGFTIEEMGRLRVHDYLERRGYAIDAIDRRLFTTARGELELDLYAEGTSDGAPVLVVGEVKSRISEREARLFLDKLQAVAGQLPADRRLVPVIFGFAIHPAARTLLQEHNGFAIESYQR